MAYSIHASSSRRGRFMAGGGGGDKRTRVVGITRLNVRSLHSGGRRRQSKLERRRGGVVVAKGKEETMRMGGETAMRVEEEFDYIVIGGGAAGCTVARRLAEAESSQEEMMMSGSADVATTRTKRKKKKILLVEDGADNRAQVVRTPAGILRLFRDERRDFAFMTEPEAKLHGRQIYLARGRGLGGSTATNAAIYHRGTALDYDAWGLAGWSADEVLPTFLRSEDNLRSGLAASSRFHATGGPQAVEDPRYENELVHRFVRAITEVEGIDEKDDFNDWDTTQEGAGRFQLTLRGGRRCDAWNGFLESSARGLDDVLEVRTRTRALRILFEGKRAAGVELADTPERVAEGLSATPYVARLSAQGKVICCAGALHTPHLLMHSGVGDRDTLGEHGIDMTHHLPGVGRNLQDQPACVSTFSVLKRGMSVTDHVYIRGNGTPHPRAILNYVLRRRGPLSSTGCEQGAFLRTRADLAQPDCQVRFIAAFSLDPDGVSTYTKFGQLKASGQGWPPGVSFQIIAARPKSRGFVTVGGANPMVDRPRVSPCYLSDAGGEDIATMRRGLEMSRKWISGSSAWGEGVVGEEAFPGPNEHDLDDYIRRTLHSSNALVGTCRMGDVGDDGSSDGIVVDASTLAVCGIEGVHVADASVIPVIPGGQTVAPTIMVAERAAEKIILAGQEIGTTAPQSSSSMEYRREVVADVA